MSRRLESPTPEEQAADAARAQRHAEAERSKIAAAKSVIWGKLITSAGKRFEDYSLETFDAPLPGQQNAVAAVREYIDSFTPESSGVLFCGPCGTGKDHLAFSILRALLRQHGTRVEWMNCQDWFGSVRDEIGKERGLSEETQIGAKARPTVLVVSDPLPPFGPLTPFQATMLYRLLDDRSAGCLPTIVTVNVASDQEAKERMGSATWDRMCDGALKIVCNWPSHRRPVKRVNC
jgi:DNA replication protein DnaC